MPEGLITAPARPQIPAPFGLAWKNAIFRSGVDRSMAYTPDFAPLQPCEIVVYRTLPYSPRLQFFENGGTNFAGGILSSPLWISSTCSFPSLEIVYTMTSSPFLTIIG